jgi:hypothetical protein
MVPLEALPVELLFHIAAEAVEMPSAGCSAL